MRRVLVGAVVGVVALTAYVSLGSAATTPKCMGKAATIVGDSGDNEIRGTSHADVIVGGRGSNEIRAYGGNDRICGQGGNDLVFGGRGNDRISGGIGRDDLRGGRGADRLSGNDAHDVLSGGTGSDRLRGQDGRDAMFGLAGRHDYCDGGRPRPDTRRNHDRAHVSCETIKSAKIFFEFAKGGRV